jgi:DNA-binding winged-HTH domains
MREFNAAGAERGRRRRWLFDDCVFDEASWSLTVSGRRVPIEAKPLELLRELLIGAGELVTKDELLNRIWPDVIVVEASIPTAIHKLRSALRDGRRDPHIVETVQRLGYRLGVRVDLEESWITAGEDRPPVSANNDSRRHSRTPAFVSFGAASLILAGIMMLPPARLQSAGSKESMIHVSQHDAANALRRLDVGSIERLLAAGWDPNRPFDNQGNGAINYVLNECEWDRGHDQEQMVLMVRTLIDGGARIDQRNVWGDTPYSIAKAVRYCGPDHPVTNSLRAMCFAGYKPFGDRCLASYELAPPQATKAVALGTR